MAKIADPKIALITGASSGIGAAIATQLSEQGHEVLLVARNEERLRGLAERLPNPAKIYTCDLSKSLSVHDLCDRLIDEGRPLDLLVNNAGIFERKSLADGDETHWDLLWRTNMLGPVNLTRRLLPLLQKSLKPSIINVASTLGLRPVAETGAYSALKAAMINWTQSLALELAPLIRVNAIAPGLVNTPIHSFHGQQESSEVVQQMNQLQPLGRVGRPEEVAEALSYLAGADWITGSTLNIDGGISL